MFDFFRHDTVLLCVSAGMFCTWYIQMYSLRFKQLTLLQKVIDSVACSLLTATICLPMLEFFPDLPPTLCLLVGSIIGTIGFSGWERLATQLVDLLFNKLGGGSLRSPRTRRNEKHEE